MNAVGGTLSRRRLAQRAAAAGGAATGAMLLAACGGTPAQPGGGGPATSAPVTVTMWHIWDGNRTEPFHTSLRMLTDKKPDVRVDPSPMAQGSDREKEQKIAAALSGGDPPDLMMIDQGIFADVAGTNAVIALDDLLKANKMRPDEWYEGAYKSSVWNGKLYGLPAVNSGPRLLYFNKAIFREVGLDPNKPPQTWEELQQASRQITKRDGDTFARVGWNPGAGNFSTLIFANKGRVFSSDGKKVVFGGPEGQQTIEYLTDFVWAVYDGPAKLADFYKAYGGTFAQSPLVTGKEALQTNGPFLVPQIRDFAPQLDYGVAPVPHARTGAFADPMFVNWMYSLPAASRKQPAAWEVAKWVGYGEGHRWFMLDQQRPGVIKKYNDDPQYPKINPHWKTINEVLEKYVVPDQVVPGRGAALAAMDKQLGAVHRREISARDGLANAVRDAQQELDQAWAHVIGK